METLLRRLWLQYCLYLIVLPSAVWSFRSLSQFSQYNRRKPSFCPMQCTMSTSSAGFIEWMKKAGVIQKDMKVKFLDGGEVVTNVDIKRGDVIISVPDNIALNAATAASTMKSMISADQLKTGEIGMAALLLIAEKLAGEKSKYYEYIQSLPSTPPGILSWKQDELEVLYRSTTRRIQSQLAAIEHDLQLVLDRNIFSEGIDRDTFLWAVGTVKARSLYVKDLGSVVMVPGIDSIKFDPFSTSEPIYQGGGLFGKGTIKVLADRDYKAGEELYISYGLKSSAECLEDHGMVPDYIDEDCSCELMLTIEETDRFCDDKLNVLEQEMLDSSLRIDLEADSSLDFGMFAIFLLDFNYSNVHQIHPNPNCDYHRSDANAVR